MELWKNPRTRSKIILISLALLAFLWILVNAWGDIVPFVFALALGYLLLPLIDRLSRKMPRVLAILLVYIIFFGSVIGLGFLVVPNLAHQIAELIDSVPEYQQRFASYTADLQAWYQGLNIPPDTRASLENSIRQWASSLGGALTTALTGTLRVVTGAVGFIFGLVVLPFWLFYVMKDKDLIVDRFNNLIPAPVRGDVQRVFSIASDTLNDYIRGQLLLGLVVGGATTIGMLLIQAPYWLLLGVIYGFTEIIPVLGPIIGAVPGLILAALTGDWTMFLKVLAVYVVVQQLENNLLVPKIQGDSVKLHPAVIILALILGSSLFGLVGLIVAVPLTAIARDVYYYLYRRFGEGLPPDIAEAMVPSRADEDKKLYPNGIPIDAQEAAEATRAARLDVGGK